VLENANELRVMLCTDKVVQTANGIKKGTNVIAACGEPAGWPSSVQQ
jgi:hypothetical protein